MFENRGVLGGTPNREVVLDVLAAGVDAAHPAQVIPETVRFDTGVLTVADQTYDLGGYDRVLVVGGGKAAGVAAAALESVLGDRIDGGAVVTDNPVGTRRIEEINGRHPVPDASGLQGAKKVLRLVDTADESTLILTILTGGGSALLPAPVEGVRLNALQSVTADLLASGVAIQDVNAVRKHLSRIKGGRLANAAVPATVVGLVFSDVIGNDPSVIASGPLAPDPTTYADARTVLETSDITSPAAVATHLEAGDRGQVPETPGPDNPCFNHVTLHILADGHTALSAARTEAQNHAFETMILSASITGEAQEAGRFHAAIATEAMTTTNPITPPAIILSGGETTVTLNETAGTGGPNQECALGAGLAMTDQRLDAGEVLFASLDTDGRDGPSSVAGALIDTDTITDSDTARRALYNHDVTPYLSERDAVIETGFTGTNVNDLRVLLLDPANRE